jgi:hypothetical protein
MNCGCFETAHTLSCLGRRSVSDAQLRLFDLAVYLCVCPSACYISEATERISLKFRITHVTQFCHKPTHSLKKMVQDTKYRPH